MKYSRRTLCLLVIVLLLQVLLVTSNNKEPVTYMLKKLPAEAFTKQPTVYKSKEFTESTMAPSSALGVQILENIEAEREAHHLNGTHASYPDLSIEEIEGTQLPGYDPNNFSHYMPVNTSLGIGIAATVFKDRSWLIGGTIDTYAYEKLIAGVEIKQVLDEVYSFEFEGCRWRIEKHVPHANNLAFSTAVHYSHPACVNVTSNNTDPTSAFIDFCEKEVLVIFGGTNGTSTRNSVWYYDVNAKEYTIMTKRDPTLYDPNELRLAGHTAIVWSHYMIVVGGLQFQYGQNIRPIFSNKIWIYDFETQEWLPSSFEGTELPAIAFHSTNLVSHSNGSFTMYVIGGLLDDGTINENIYTLQVNFTGNVTTYMNECKENITIVLPTVKFNELPQTDCPRNGTFGHKSVVFGDDIFVFGGARYNDASTKFPIPLPNQQTVVDPTYKVSGELWRYDIPSGLWYNITECNPWILPKFGLVLLEYDQKLQFFAGVNENYNISTGVHSLNLASGRYEFVPCCAPGYTGKRCETPICSCGCGGENVGKCVAPDTCECYNGFFGEGCTQHVCDDKYGYNLVSLNSVVFYPTAVNNLRNKVKQTLQKLEYIKDNLPQWDSAFVDLDLKPVAKALFDFNEQEVDNFMSKTNNLLKQINHL